MEDQTDKGYEVIDKRGNRDEPPPPEEQAEPEPQEAAEQEEPVVISVYGMLGWFVSMLSESAWQFMGLVPNPITKKIEKDMIQAKMAVDSVVFMTDQLGPHVPEEQRRAYRTLVSDLRVNFVQQMEKE